MSNTSDELLRFYTIHLGKAWIAPKHRRAVRVITLIKEFAIRHMKSDSVMISPDVNLHVWKRGIQNPPRKIRVQITKNSEGLLVISLPKDESAEDVKPVEEAKPAEDANNNSVKGE